MDLDFLDGLTNVKPLDLKKRVEPDYLLLQTYDAQYRGMVIRIVVASVLLLVFMVLP